MEDVYLTVLRSAAAEGDRVSFSELQFSLAKCFANKLGSKQKQQLFSGPAAGDDSCRATQASVEILSQYANQDSAQKTRDEQPKAANNKRERKASAKSSTSVGEGRWSQDERDKFYEGILKFGKKPSQIAEFMGTRTK